MVPLDVSLGLWVDAARSEVVSPAFAKLIGEDLKFDLIAVMIDQSDSDPTFSFKPVHVEQLLRNLDPYNIELVLTTWPYPQRQQIDQQVKQMKELLKVGAVAGWEVDLEFNWKSVRRGQNMVIGFKDIDEAGDYLVENMIETCHLQDARMEMTSFTEHVENSSRADVAPEADRLLVQAYSVDTRNEEPVDWNSKYGPGKMQTFTLDKTLQVPGVNTVSGPKLGVGLAAWDQDFPGHHPEEAMRVALDKALEYNPIDVRWWSYNHIAKKGKPKNNAAFKFLKSLRNS